MHAAFFKRVLVVTLVASTVFPMAPLAAAPGVKVAAKDGCENHWMFNGIWRVRVTGFSPHIADNQQTGWDVTEQWRNGTDQTLAPGPGTFSTGQQLVLQNGDVIGASDSTTGALSQQVVDYHDFPPSAQYTHTQFFYANTVDPNDKPVAVVIPFDADKLAQVANRPHFSIRPPSYRIMFACTADELARAVKAQGGSFEIPAHEGCIGKWISNGIWRVRVTKVVAAPVDPTTNQPTGWDVTEEWVNTLKRTMTPNDSYVLDQALVLSNGDTVSSSNTTGATLTAQQLDYHTFEPGASFMHTQPFRLFRQAIDPTIKTSKLLLMFDTKQFKALPDRPQYSPPAPNIRITLDCPT